MDVVAAFSTQCSATYTLEWYTLFWISRITISDIQNNNYGYPEWNIYFGYLNVTFLDISNNYFGCHVKSDQEEAHRTDITCCWCDHATACCATIVDIWSQVLVMLICHHPALCGRKTLSPGTENNHRTTQLRQVCDACRPRKTAAGGTIWHWQLYIASVAATHLLAGNWKQLLEGISSCKWFHLTTLSGGLTHREISLFAVTAIFPRAWLPVGYLLTSQMLALCPSWLYFTVEWIRGVSTTLYHARHPL